MAQLPLDIVYSYLVATGMNIRFRAESPLCTGMQPESMEGRSVEASAQSTYLPSAIVTAAARAASEGLLRQMPECPGGSRHQAIRGQSAKHWTTCGSWTPGAGCGSRYAQQARWPRGLRAGAQWGSRGMTTLCWCTAGVGMAAPFLGTSGCTMTQQTPGEPIPLCIPSPPSFRKHFHPIAVHQLPCNSVRSAAVAVQHALPRCAAPWRLPQSFMVR